MDLGTGFVWSGLGSRGDTGEALWEGAGSFLPADLTGPIPACSRMDPPLAQVKPINNSGGNIGIGYFRIGQKLCNWSQRSKNLWEKQLCGHQGQWRRMGKGCSRQQIWEFPWSPWCRPWWGSCSSWRSMGEQRSTCSQRKTPGQNRWILKENCDHVWTVTMWAGSWQDLWNHGERSLCWSRFSSWTCHPMGGWHKSRLCLKDCILGKDQHCCSLWRAVAHGKDAHGRNSWNTLSKRGTLGAETGEEWEVLSPPEQEGVAETMYDDWPKPQSLNLLCLCGREDREFGNIVNSGKKGGMGRRRLKILILFCIILLWFVW